jgi:heat shock protein HslJ
MKYKFLVLILILSVVLAACMNADSLSKSALAAEESSESAQVDMESEAVAATELENTFWVLANLNGAETLSVDEGGQPATLQYDPATGKIAGTTGCNQYFADAQVDLEAGTISVGAIGMTRMACRGPVADQEMAFVSLLEKIARYEISGSQLTLLGEDGEALVFKGK